MSGQSDRVLLPPETLWRVRFFVRDRYIDCELQAPNSGLATTMARQSIFADGIPEHQITWIETERLT